MDGTIYRGSRIIPNADKTINHLKELGKKIVFVSNKTTGSVRDYYLFLKSNGLNIDEDEIVNSTVVIKKYLIENFKTSRFFAVGEKVFINELVEAGLTYSEDANQVDILLVTLDRTITYEKL